MPKKKLITNKAICAFQKHIFFWVYMKRKPHKNVVKIVQLCEAKSGYMYNSEIYAGEHQEQGTYCVNGLIIF
jgi:hypothetical protein